MNDRIHKDELQANGKPLLGEARNLIRLRVSDKSYLITEGEFTAFCGLDKLFAAAMIKIGINEITLTEEDLSKVDLLCLDWRERGKGATIMVNQLPEKNGNMLVAINQYSDLDYFDSRSKRYWDFCNENSDGGTKEIVLVPNEYEGDLEAQKDFINNLLMKDNEQSFGGFKIQGQNEPTEQTLPKLKWFEFLKKYFK